MRVIDKENIRLTKKPSFHDSKFAKNEEEVEVIGEMFLEVPMKYFTLIKNDIPKEMNIIAGLLFQLWQKYIEILKFATFEITDSLMKNYNSKLKTK